MDRARKLFRKFVYSIEHRPWTPMEKKQLFSLTDNVALPRHLPKNYGALRFLPQQFLSELREELRSLVDVDWYRENYSDLGAQRQPEEHFVEFGILLGHMPNAFIELSHRKSPPTQGFWRPQSVAEFLLRADWATAQIGEKFSPGAYLDLYPDIGLAGVNPLTHFVRHGLREGRQATASSRSGFVEATQGFNVDTLAADWISIRGTHVTDTVTSVLVYKNEALLGKARLGLPDTFGGALPGTCLNGFAFSSQVTVGGPGEMLTVVSEDDHGGHEVLFEIELHPNRIGLEAPATTAAQTYEAIAAFPHKTHTSEEVGKRRVLVLTHHLGIGGGQLYLQEILRGLATTDEFDITVISMVGGALEKELRDLGFEVLICAGPEPFSKAMYEDYLWNFEKVIRGRAFDVFLANTLGCFPQVDWCLRNGIDGHWAIHESYSREGWARAAFGRPIDSYVFSRLNHALTHVDSVVFEAQGTLDVVMDGLPACNSEIVKYGVAIPVGALAWKSPRGLRRAGKVRNLSLLAVGTFEERKAQGLIVRAISHLQKQGIRVEIKLVGLRPDDRYSESIRKSVIEMDLKKLVTLHEVTLGWEKLLERTDYFFMPSDVESMPQSMMIAMSHGVPAIGARVFGIPELITDGVSGFIHEPNDLKDITAVLAKARELPEGEYLDMRHAAREFITAEHEKTSYVNFFRSRLLAKD